MERIAILVLADSESHADMGRVTNALETAKEAQEAGDDVVIIFDGAGTTWIEKLTDADYPLNDLYRAVEPSVAGVCSYCADAFDVGETIDETDVERLEEFEGHPSVRGLVADGYDVITF